VSPRSVCDVAVEVHRAGLRRGARRIAVRPPDVDESAADEVRGVLVAVRRGDAAAVEDRTELGALYGDAERDLAREEERLAVKAQVAALEAGARERVVEEERAEAQRAAGEANPAVARWAERCDGVAAMASGSSSMEGAASSVVSSPTARRVASASRWLMCM